MHNTRSAMASLVNRYKAVLKKCHLLNTFGSLALAASLVTGAVGGTGLVGFAHAVDADAATTYASTSAEESYELTLDSVKAAELEAILHDLTENNSAPGTNASWEEFISKATGEYYDELTDYFDSIDIQEPSSAYTVVSQNDVENFTDSDYYTTFIMEEADADGTITETKYGILLNTSNSTTTKSIDTLIADYVNSAKNNTNYIVGNETVAVKINDIEYDFVDPTSYDNRITTIYDNDAISGTFAGLSATTDQSGGAISIKDESVSGVTISGYFVGI